MGNTYMKVILKKQFEIVGAKFKGIPTEEDWFLKHEWTDEQEKEFEKFFIEYLMNNAEARRELLTFNTKNKTRIKKAFDMWNLNYGWKSKVKGDENEKEKSIKS